ncbi:MAG: hypothetical protein WC081_01500 [Candidatus Ratteibacteria bacterium]
MKKLLLLIGTLALSYPLFAAPVNKAMTVPKTTIARVGTYDSRAVAAAYVGTTAFNKDMKELTTKYEKAKNEGNKKRMAELEAQGKAQQVLLHKQGFSTAPVDNILEHIKGKLPEIARKSGVEVIVSKWDKKTLAKYKSAEFVDVTMALVDALQPNDRQRKSAIEIQKHKPISLRQAGNIND